MYCVETVLPFALRFGVRVTVFVRLTFDSKVVHLNLRVPATHALVGRLIFFRSCSVLHSKYVFSALVR